MKLLYFLILSQLAACSSGCASTYLSAADLKDAKKGPKECETSCRQLDMRMGALALIDSQHAGCVCVPNTPAASTPGAVASASTDEQAAAIAGASAVISDEEQQRRQQQQQRHQVTPAH